MNASVANRLRGVIAAVKRPFVALRGVIAAVKRRFVALREAIAVVRRPLVAMLIVLAVLATGALWLDLTTDTGFAVLKPLRQTAPGVGVHPIAKIDPALLDKGPDGALPRISKDGRQPWRHYAARFKYKGPRPQIAVIVTGLGLKRAITEAAITKLPAVVALAFSPYAEDLPRWTKRAREAGHEILVAAPMEPIGYPSNDPGDKAMFVTLTQSENIARLRWVMSRFAGYVGITGHMGSRFLGSAEAVRPFLAELKARGLMYLDNGDPAARVSLKIAGALELPRAATDRRIDDQPSPDAIDARLGEIEEIARKRRFAVAFARPYPVTIDRLLAWLDRLEAKGLKVVPITSLANKQKLP